MSNDKSGPTEQDLIRLQEEVAKIREREREERREA
jgi:hypothetical protein